MRPDMAKVIVERPRHGSRMRGYSKGYAKLYHGIPLDELPRFERMKPMRGDWKHLNEHLSPLFRYLQKQVGRPWDKVFAEICAHISRDSAVQDHVRDHVQDFVAVNVFEINGVLYDASRWGWPIRLSHGGRFSTLYVCPKTGILKRIKGKRQRFKQRQELLPLPVLHVEYGLSFVQRFGFWHHVRFESFPKRPVTQFTPPIHVFDSLLQAKLERSDTIKNYGRPIYATEVRRATRAEIRKFCEPLKAPNLV